MHISSGTYFVKDKDGRVIRPWPRPRAGDDGEVDLFSDDDEDEEVTFKKGYFN